MTRHSYLVLQAAALSLPPPQSCSLAVGPRAPGTGTNLPMAEHHSPLSLPTGGPEALALDHSVVHFAFSTDSLFLSTVPSPRWRQKHFFFLLSVYFCHNYSLLPTPRSLAGTESLCPWTVFPTGSFTETDLCVTLQSLLVEHPLPTAHSGVCVPVVSGHHSLGLVEFFP